MLNIEMTCKCNEISWGENVYTGPEWGGYGFIMLIQGYDFFFNSNAPFWL